MRLRLVSAQDIDAALSMPEAIEATARAFLALSAGEALVPLRVHLPTPGGVTIFKPGYLKKENALSVKVVSVFADNPARGLPTVQAVVLALDPATGTPTALLDGTRLTALRTGAAAGAATRLLAPPEARVMALFGAGGNAPDQAEAVLAVRPLAELRVFDPNRAGAERLAGLLAGRHPGLNVRAAATPAEAVRGADVVSAATTSRRPVFDPADLKPGAHINGIGSFTPEMREIEVRGLADLRVFVDSMESALAEAGDLIQAIDEGILNPADLVELGLALAGRAPGRTGPRETTFFKSVGTAAQDVATAQAVLAAADRLGLGRMVEL